MAFPRLDIVDTDETTVLWSLNDQLGTVNPNSVKAKLGPVDFGLRTEITTAEYLATGGQVSGYRDPIATATLTFYPAAATADARTTGLGVLNKLLERGGVMIWQPTSGSPLRYIDFLASPHVSVYQGQHVANLASVDEGVALQFLMQPYLRAAETSVTGVTVPDDPATGTKVRVFPLTVSGDLPTPGRIRVQMDSGATVERVLIAHRAQGSKPSSAMSDYLAETGFAQCEANGRGWTRTLGVDTAGAVDGNGSPGSGTTVAQTTYDTVATMAERVKLERTTLMDSLRGSWDVWVRVRSEVAAFHTLQMKWSPSATGEAAFAEAEVPHDTTLAPAFGYAEKMLGTIHIPEGAVPIGGLQIRLYSRRDSGTFGLAWDLIWLVPHDQQGTVVVAGAGTSSWLGDVLLSPVTDPGSGTAGVPNTTQHFMALDTTTDNAGVSPNAGTVLPAGRYRVRFNLGNTNPATARTALLAVRNVTSSTYTVSRTVSVVNGTGSGGQWFDLSFDANGTSAYQLQVDDPSAGTLRVFKITQDFLPYLANAESFRTEPGDRYGIDRLDSAANLAGYLGVEGIIPAWLEPGLNHIMVRADEIPLVGYEECQNKLARTPTVSVIYAPRNAL